MSYAPFIECRTRLNLWVQCSWVIATETGPERVQPKIRAEIVGMARRSGFLVKLSSNWLA